MRKRPSSTARTLAVLALAAGFVVLIVIVSAALNSSSESGGSGKASAPHVHHSKEPEEVQKTVPATYVIKSGDTLTAIAHATGVSVAKIERLNPEVDPQILIAGETLKLK